MMDILKNLFVSVTVVLTSMYSSVASLRPQAPHPSPTPSSIAITATASATPQITPKPTNKPTSTQKPQATKSEVTPILQVSLTPAAITPSNPTFNQPVVNNTAPKTKTDYSSYKISLQNTLYSLNSRLTSVRSNADNLPNQAEATKNAINVKLQTDLGILENNYNNSIKAANNNLAQRGLSTRDQYAQSIIQPIIDAYNSQKQALIDKANQDISQATNNAINLVYQADSQDKDLSNKIVVIQSLIDKILSGSFSDSDIPLTLQAIQY